METVFITIHDLSLDARIRYVSDSVEDILGYLPHEVRGKSCWEYFHPDQIPFAREIHGRGIQLDKAAVLNYCQIKHKDGSWVGCECVFTLVYDVLVATTSIYRRGPRSQQRALEAPSIRRIFSSSPRDPRYHMLSYISSKFYTEPRAQLHEPRAALFLNRFTRTSTIMFATDGVSSILGVSAQQLTGKSFYYCIAENCLKDAVQCLESAKANDSIAYLRFWYRDPLQDAPRTRDTSMPDISSDDEDNDEGGVRIRSLSPETQLPKQTESIESRVNPQPDQLAAAPRIEADKSRSSSGNSVDLDHNSEDVFDAAAPRSPSASMTPIEDYAGPIEIEAVVSCTSDGLVVVLRRARPFMPSTLEDPTPHFANGLFASPWAPDPVMPPDARDANALRAERLATEPEPADFLAAIREVAVFAWSLTGINGDLSRYARGTPTGEALPTGLPIWDPDSSDPDGDQYNGFMTGSHRPVDAEAAERLFGLERKEDDITSSDEEIIFKRVPVMPAFKRPKRRVREEAFGSDSEETAEDKRPNKRNTEAGGVRLDVGSLSPMKLDKDVNGKDDKSV